MERKTKFSRYFMKMNENCPIGYLEHGLRLSKYMGSTIATRDTVVNPHVYW